ncbi:hypothetical protein KEM56_005576, partial [Ascosphaera pollenicola]
MAPRHASSEPPPSIAPLADFFWIAGVDGVELYEKFRKLGEEYQHSHAPPANKPPSNNGHNLEPSNGSHNARTSSLLQDPTANTIEEDADAEEEEEEEEEDDHHSTRDASPHALDPRLSTITAHRLVPTREPSESRLSFRSFVSESFNVPQERESHSNRSSMTIKDRNGGTSVRTSFT